MIAGTKFTNDGSSPLTRGKRHADALSRPRSGLIPAHAGKTFAVSGPMRPSAAHPRSRGENVLNKTGKPEPVGSSPLTRGKPGGHGAPGFRRRLIPAHAGKTNRSGVYVSYSPAHPRSRGENGGHGFPFRLVDGSSPLTRGKRDRPAGRVAGPGLIPAHAGKTPPAPEGGPACPAHPRSRGENGSM